MTTTQQSAYSFHTYIDKYQIWAQCRTSLLVDSKAHLVDSKAHLVDSKAHLVDSKAHLVDSKAHLVDSKAHLVDSKAHFSRFKSSLELMLCAIDISTLNKTYLIWFDQLQC
jgi:hypothetical protein